MVEGTQDKWTYGDIPPAQRHIIERPRLYRLLDQANARIILLVAPAGYGKTTLARQWTSRHGKRAFWYRSDTSSTDPAALARGIANAVASEFHDAPRRLQEYLLGANRPQDAPSVLADVLAESIAPWPSTSWLVIDDYQAFLNAQASETLIENLAEAARLNLVITSRTSPTWISARRILYGAIHAVGPEELAMNEEEAQTVLSLSRGVNSESVVKTAGGWPAVIGLAALVPSSLDVASLRRDSLHDYIAQELFETIDVAVRPALPLLALPDRLNRDVLRIIFGAEDERMRAEAHRVGLIAERESGRIEMHPLIREFLRTKLDEANVDPTLVDELVFYFVGHGDWDDAFALIEKYDLHDHLRHLFAAATMPALETGRTATIEQWLGWASSVDFDAPELGLARAELALRSGDWGACQAMAAASAPLIQDAALSAEAYLCAGSAAQLSDDYKSAGAFFDAALDRDPSASTIRTATWGKFLVSMQDFASRDVAQAALDALSALPDSSPAHVIRVAQARVICAEYFGQLANAADSALRVAALVEDVGDPMPATGFLNVLADALGATARYADAERMARLELEIAKRNRLSFVTPNALLVIAAARLGVADYIGAKAAIEEIYRMRSTVVDSFVVAHAHALFTRVQIASGRASDVPDAIDIPRDARASIRSEALAALALAAAISGDLTRALSLVEESQDPLEFCSAKVLRAATLAVLAIADSRQSVDALASFVEIATAAQVFADVVCATRGSERLLKALLDLREGNALLRVVQARSGDIELRQALHLPDARPRASDVLTRREREILALVAQGMKNTDIARRLFISPKTVKTHLQNVYEKLGARSRVEAVMRAKDARLLD
jgi:LuxR family maltose regulon positive regulatory protein